MAYSFGDDAVFLELKESWASGDQNRVVELLQRSLKPIVATQLRKEGFAMFTAEDRQDAEQEALFYVFRKLGGFLANPLNDPTCKDKKRFTPRRRQAWAHLWVGNALKHIRDQAKPSLSPGIGEEKYCKVDSLDREVSDENGSRLMDSLSDGHSVPDENLLKRERLTQACRAFFSLKNTPELLTAVGFVILSESLTGTHRSLDTYADLLNGMPVLKVVAAISRMLDEYGIDLAALDSLKKRLGDDENQKIDGLTAKTLANRKNSMLSTLRNGPAGEEE